MEELVHQWRNAAGPGCRAGVPVVFIPEHNGYNVCGGVLVTRIQSSGLDLNSRNACGMNCVGSSPERSATLPDSPPRNVQKNPFSQISLSQPRRQAGIKNVHASREKRTSRLEQSRSEFNGGRRASKRSTALEFDSERQPDADDCGSRGNQHGSVVGIA